jgi:hypothetical protein
MGLVALGCDDQALDLQRQLVGVANRPARAARALTGQQVISNAARIPPLLSEASPPVVNDPVSGS